MNSFYCVQQTKHPYQLQAVRFAVVSSGSITLCNKLQLLAEASHAGDLPLQQPHLLCDCIVFLATLLFWGVLERLLHDIAMATACHDALLSPSCD